MHYPKFRETSKYYEKMYNTDGTFADTLDGNIAVNALAEMEENFARNIPEAEVEDTINSPHLFS
jgi:Ca2+-binding EF-hand superfamily protein